MSSQVLLPNTKHTHTHKHTNRTFPLHFQFQNSKHWKGYKNAKDMAPNFKNYITIQQKSERVVNRKVVKSVH